MAAYLKLKDEQMSCHYYYDVTCPNQPVVPCKNSQDQGAKVKQMLPCFPIPTEDMEEDEEEIMELLDLFCFKGNKHMKRGQGIRSFPVEILFELKQEDSIDIHKLISEMFKKRFKKRVSVSRVLSNSTNRGPIV